MHKIWSRVNFAGPSCGRYPELRWKTIDEAETLALNGSLHKDLCGYLAKSTNPYFASVLRSLRRNLLNEDADKGNKNEAQNEQQFVGKM